MKMRAFIQKLILKPFITGVLVFAMLGVFSARAQSTCLNLFSTGNSSDGFINLEWQWLIPPTETYGYVLYQWDNALNIWQSTSTHCDKEIKVLNVYPDLPASNTLKTWMEDPAVGLGKINVTPVTITNFNINPDSYLKNGSGQYQYDVIMFGSWDGNYGKDLTPISATAVRNFLNSGRGVLFGHDTKRMIWPNFASLKDKTNLDIDQNGDRPEIWRGSINTQIINNGFLLKYPHFIPYNSILTIPFSHSTGQLAKGVVWMNYPNTNGAPENCLSPEVWINGGTNNFYLTTWNNAAFIQTGHSNGQSTLDERKIIANTLWYLAQFTTETNTKVCSSPDLAAPDKPVANRQTTDCSKIEIISKDNGTLYKFYVKAINMVDNSDTCKSNIIEVLKKSGLKGYYILENNNATSASNISSAPFFAAKENQLFTYTIQATSKYVHIQAVDSAGNLSAVSTLSPLEPYKVTATANPEGAGTISGTGTFNCSETVTLIATPAEKYLFINWIEAGNIVSTNSTFSFIVTNDRNMMANFVSEDPNILDFDTYAVIICDRVILLNLKKLEEDGFDVTGCKWFKNETEQRETHTINAFSFAEGSDKRLEKSPTYYWFKLITKNYGELPSSKKIIIGADKMVGCPEAETSQNLLVYPNPVVKGSILTIEGVVADSQIYVHNHLGACVFNTVATNDNMKLRLDFPHGIYLIRNESKIVKIIIIK